MKSNLTVTTWSIIAAVAAVFLWDPDGLAIGTSILPLGPFLTKVISGIGDALWIPASFVVLMGGVAFYAIGKMAREGRVGVRWVRDYISGTGANPDIVQNVSFGTMDGYIVGIGALGLISGFWYSGTAILFMMWGLHAFRTTFIKRNREYHEYLRRTNSVGGASTE